ncbi:MULTISPECIES: efflux RND transporter permease subunit [Halomonadaceae]|uniref:Multidrug efflux pump n=1 Tax=Vreelandella aquamarina TaxID=77097 RepID=A0A1H8L9P7_9GAMM|nr:MULTISPECIES: efflux RND transporter permease subunit [Halomonas]MCC4288395.1 efflux RND transporter permease subunit [Halomonas meridiana]MCD1652926.1 efflux RND transporter permease subunit [Halomonas axialensis]MCD2089230.1 efflux RND transporter permease subunit [Halomonas meridiana]SEO01789.1 multidrug efflux pump [Halomonas aquamarina]
MRQLINAALTHTRTTLLLLVGLLLAGTAAWQAIPKEANPDVTIPIIYVSLALEGVSPEDGERLLVRPMEQELRGIEGLRKFTAQSSEGHGSVTLEFDPGFDPDTALADVRERVDIARSSLPDEAEEPRVMEVNVSEFPVLSIGLSGDLDTRERMTIARRLKEEIEGIADVLEVEIAGEREDLLEIVVDPLVLESYGVDFDTLFNQISRNNRLVAAGSLDTGAGRLALKVPGIIESLNDVMNMPVKVEGDQVVTFGDVAWIHPTYKEAEGFARIDGQPAVVLEISKRAGANIIATIEAVREQLALAEDLLPEQLRITTILDESVTVQNMLSELLNNVLTAVVLVLIVVVAVMGWRMALLVGLTIPGAFLTGILLVWAFGFTLNIVVLFALILVAGMLVDGAIVVSELADRHLHDGQAPHQAWLDAASRMSWPVIASTATTLAVFIPLLFWPGVVGQFMKYLPATVILCLLASLAMALVFLPTLGRLFTRTSHASGYGPIDESTALGRGYRRILSRLLQHPAWVLLFAVLLIALLYTGYARFNHGVDFFPSVEPDSAQVLVRARGDFSAEETDAILQRVEQRLGGMGEVEALYARSYAVPDQQMGSDVIGMLQFQFIDWYQRRPARTILADMAERTQDIPGITLEFQEQEMGPGGGKPIVLEVSATDPDIADAGVDQITAMMRNLGGFTDIQDNRSLPGVEWQVHVDREAAARMGTDITTIGSAVQLLTTGLQIASYRPPTVNDEVDIRVRLPENWRTLNQLERLTINTPRGQVPISHFVEITPAPKVGTLNRIDGRRAITVEADLAPEFLADERLRALLDAGQGQLPDGLMVNVAGEQEDQQESMQFLVSAFLVAIGLMALILVTQFNSYYQAALVLSAIVFSTAGVLMGLLITGQAFGIVMVGMGVIALAGIVVNNNIVLIDTYNELRAEGMPPAQAALEAGCLRLRPVLLTAITTVLGLMPMVLGVNVNLFAPALGFNAPSAQWWTQMSSAIAGGLTFATFLTLLLTPCMLVIGGRLRREKDLG